MLETRPPIVVILGHVDHGKTSLLDYLRKSNIAARESGGITQHISSFNKIFEIGNSKLEITFVDTPGHAAFSAMRERGSKIADIAVLVVAGNDGVMPQTKQSIQFIKQAGLPFVVAINKSDLSTFDPDKVKTQLTELEIVVEDYGGTVPAVNISAKTGAGIDDLLEVIHLIAQLDPPQADSNGVMEAVVLESRMDLNKGPVAVVVVKNGTLTYATPLFQDHQIGKTKAIVGSDGKNLQSATPSMPVELIGLNTVVEVGSSIFSVLQTPKQTLPANKTNQPVKPFFGSQPAEEEKIKIVLKTDVAGSLEAILSSLPSDVEVVSSSAGPVTDTDVDIAKTSKSTVISFNAKVPSPVSKLAEVEKVTIVEFKIIYELFDYLENLKKPKTIEEITGRAEILAEFKIDKDKIAGCRCTEGILNKGDQVKIMRGDKVVAVSKIRSIQLGKSQVEKVKSIAECGILLSPVVDFRLQDSIIAFKTHGSS